MGGCGFLSPLLGKKRPLPCHAQLKYLPLVETCKIQLLCWVICLLLKKPSLAVRPSRPSEKYHTTPVSPLLLFRGTFHYKHFLLIW